MRSGWSFHASVAAAVLLAGCASPPPGAERGPDGTIAYDVLVEASPPGARIEANGSYVGDAPVHLKIFGNLDGTFHDFGSYYYVVRALPLATNQFVQARVFRTGRGFNSRDKIPRQLYFDMNLHSPVYAPLQPPANPAAPPPAYYYGPAPYYYYGPGWYYGPEFRFYYGPRFHRHW